jgi:hypothetical protein
VRYFRLYIDERRESTATLRRAGCSFITTIVIIIIIKEEPTTLALTLNKGGHPPTPIYFNSLSMWSSSLLS